MSSRAYQIGDPVTVRDYAGETTAARVISCVSSCDRTWLRLDNGLAFVLIDAYGQWLEIRALAWSGGKPVHGEVVIGSLVLLGPTRLADRLVDAAWRGLDVVPVLADDRVHPDATTWSIAVWPARSFKDDVAVSGPLGARHVRVPIIVGVDPTTGHPGRLYDVAALRDELCKSQDMHR